MSPIEPVWHWVGRHFARDPRLAASKDELLMHIQAIWNSLLRADIQNVFDSMPHRIAALIAALGQGTSQAIPVVEYPPIGGICPPTESCADITQKDEIWSVCSSEKSDIVCKDLAPVPLTCQNTPVEHIKVGIRDSDSFRKGSI
ncbi:transposable element Tcb2 transposase [Trichonephila clavipes]|nr:transposable element Tcb2 transposase [Trichonephila clavipes]